MPNTDKKGRTFKVAKTNNPNDFLTEEQAEFVYKRVNTGNCINTKMLQQEMAQTKLVELNNTYQKATLADINKKKDPAQIEE